MTWQHLAAVDAQHIVLLIGGYLSFFVFGFVAGMWHGRRDKDAS